MQRTGVMREEACGSCVYLEQTMSVSIPFPANVDPICTLDLIGYPSIIISDANVPNETVKEIK